MNHFLTILKKELLDLLRDKKTVIMGILLPIILYPIMMIGMDKLAEKSFDVNKKNFSIVVQDDGNSQVRELLKGQKNITIKDEKDAKKALKDGDISLIVEVPKDFDESVKSQKISEVKLIYDDKSQDSAMLNSMIQSVMNEYGQKVAEQRLKDKGIDTSILTPFTTESSDISKTASGKDDAASGIVKGMMMVLPTLVVMLLLMPTIGIAVDLCAGEKERQTMEPLLSTAVNRTSIVWAKIAALAVVAIITLVCTLGAMSVSIKTIGNNAEMTFVNARFILSTGITCLFLVLAFGALQIAISIYARSIKEANSYLSGVSVLSMVLCYVPFMMDAKSIQMVFFNIPVVNTTCLLKELMAGIYRTDHLLIVLAWNVVYTVAAVLFARYMFSKEEVIFRS